jgi:hypothetical protein
MRPTGLDESKHRVMLANERVNEGRRDEARGSTRTCLTGQSAGIVDESARRLNENEIDNDRLGREK